MSRGLPGLKNLGGHPRRVYERPPLVLALCQVRFPTRFSVNNHGGVVAAFQDVIASDYPETPPPTQNLAQIRVLDGDSQIPIQPPIVPIVWQFADQSGNWSVVLTQDFVTLETRAYNYFGDFLDRLSRILAALTETVHPALCKRIGLRYINEIRPGHQKWDRVIRPEMLGLLAIEPFTRHVTQAVQHVVLKTGEAEIHVQHGVVPTGTTVQPRPGDQVETTPFYLLDTDVSREFSTPGAMTMDPVSICEQVHTFHDTISEIFRWSTTADFAATLGEQCDVGR